MPKLQYKEGADFPELPTKTPVLCKIVESEFVTEDNPFYGRENKDGKIDENETRDVIKIVFKSIEEETEGTKVWFNPSASINEKSNLRKLLDAMFETDPDKATLEAFDTDDLVGMYVYVIGTYGPKDTDHKFLRPESFARYAKQFKPGFKRPAENETTTKRAETMDDGGDDDDEEKLAAKLAALKAKRAAAAKAEPKEETKAERLRRELAELEAEEGKGEPEEKPARKTSTREKAVAKTKTKAEKEDPEAAF
jgi:hypothetical protein